MRGDDPVRRTSRSTSRSRRKAQAAGIATIYQEINLAPYRSVAENIFWSREPKRRVRPARPAAPCVRRSARRAHTLQSRHRCRAPARAISAPRHADGGHRPRRRSRMPASSSWTSPPLRSTSARSRCCSRRSARLKSARRRRSCFISHRLDELYAICDRVTIMRDGRTVAGQPRWQACSKIELVASHARQGTRRLHGQARESRGSEQRRWSGVRTRDLAAGLRVRDVQLEVGSRRDCRASPACSAPAAPRPPRLVFGADKRGRRQGRASTARSDAYSEPADAIARRHGFRLRGPQGRRHHPRHGDAREHDAGAAAAAARRPASSTAPRSRRSSTRFIKRARRQLRLAGAADHASCRAATSRRCCWRAGSALIRKLLIIDEPTRGIDIGAKAEILKPDAQARRRGL